MLRHRLRHARWSSISLTLAVLAGRVGRLAEVGGEVVRLLEVGGVVVRLLEVAVRVERRPADETLVIEL